MAPPKPAPHSCGQHRLHTTPVQKPRGPTCCRKASTLSSLAKEGEPPASFISAPTTTCTG